MELPNKLTFFKIPAEAEIMLFLLSEEMKNRRHINRLSEVGFDTAHTCDLSKLILALQGFHELSDELFEWYDGALDAACMNVSPAYADAWKDAVLEFYVQLKNKSSG